ncbi:ATP-binding protein [Klebsiella pneumoniae subsp. pneumoniae]|nr:ATP-binding protein [Klebsiella pneumoniae subsp. pneumoniae]
MDSGGLSFITITSAVKKNFSGPCHRNAGADCRVPHENIVTLRGTVCLNQKINQTAANKNVHLPGRITGCSTERFYQREKDMRLKSMAVKNFRCYAQEVSVEFDDLTTFVGRNDKGKSTILEALEIFFNNMVSIEKGDACIHSGQDSVEITCEFIELPPSLTLDSGAETTLQEEFLPDGKRLTENP